MTRAALLALVLAIAGVACSGDDDDAAVPDGTTTTTSSTAPTSTTAKPASIEDEVTARYLAYWDARLAANEEGAPESDDELRDLATGAQLEQVLEETVRNREEGIAFRRPESSVAEHRVSIIEIADDVARLHDCSVNDGIVYRVATGEVIDDSVGTNSVEATMRLVDGVWKLEAARLLQQWDGMAGCALAE